MKKLEILAEKIKRQVGSFSCLLASRETIILPEEPRLFEAMSHSFEYPLKDRNEKFFAFLEELYEGKQAAEEESSGGNFNFIRLKIIKAEMRWHLNRLFSALNLASHVASKLHDDIIPTPSHYTFQPPSLVIRYELNCKRISFYNERPATC
jgi:hypothetical protein